MGGGAAIRRLSRDAEGGGWGLQRPEYLLYTHSHAHTSFTNMKLSRKPSMSWDTDNHTKPDSKDIQMNNK